MSVTRLKISDVLPLTCTLEGTCCHGKAVWINPWELASLAHARGEAARAFRDRDTLHGGIRLSFSGPRGYQGQTACSQFEPGLGCRSHTGRPLACRLYPLGRERQGDSVRYIHHGKAFPCLQGCPTVTTLPKKTVEIYLQEQGVEEAAAVQDAYLEVVQDLAEGGFVLLLETGLAQSGDKLTLPRWRALGRMKPEERVARLDPEWLDRLTLPPLDVESLPPLAFVDAHHGLLQEAAQDTFGSLDSPEAVREASCLMIGLALHLAQSLGADPAVLVQHWASTARSRGAKE